MMLDVADANDLPGQSSARTPGDSDAPSPDHRNTAPDAGGAGAAGGRGANPPEIIDAEIVDETSAPGRAGNGRTRPHPDDRPGSTRGDEPRSEGPVQGERDSDDESFRQYQQFLEFQKFQEWQRRHGDTAPPPGVPWGPPPRRPWWKRALRLLRFKLVRRVLYVVLLLLLLNAGLNYYFGDGGQPDGGSGGGPTSGQGGDPGSRPVLQTNPRAAVIAVYDFVATKPDTVCVLFTPSARAQFARHHGAPDCSAAARELHARVTDPMAYKSPEFGQGAVRLVGTDAEVSSCALQVRGGPRLGRFGLERRPGGGWIITGHAKEPACSP